MSIPNITNKGRKCKWHVGTSYWRKATRSELRKAPSVRAVNVKRMSHIPIVAQARLCDLDYAVCIAYFPLHGFWWGGYVPMRIAIA